MQPPLGGLSSFASSYGLTRGAMASCETRQVCGEEDPSIPVRERSRVCFYRSRARGEGRDDQKTNKVRNSRGEMLSKSWCPVDLIGRINICEGWFWRGKVFMEISRGSRAKWMGRWKTFSREPAEFLAGKGEERRRGSL